MEDLRRLYNAADMKDARRYLGIIIEKYEDKAHAVFKMIEEILMI